MLALAGVACGSDDDGGTIREPRSEDDADTVRAALDDIPKYPRSRLRETSVPADGEYVASYVVTNTNVGAISDYYVEELGSLAGGSWIR